MGKGMRAGKKPKAPGAGNMQKQLQQMQAMQRQMEQMQAELEEKEITTTSGGGRCQRDRQRKEGDRLPEHRQRRGRS